MRLNDVPIHQLAQAEQESLKDFAKAGIAASIDLSDPEVRRQPIQALALALALLDNARCR